MQDTRQVLAIVEDVFFVAKVQDAVRRAGLEVVLARTRGQALEKARAGVRAIVLDLNAAGAEPLELLRDLKSDDATRALPVIAYVSHVQTDLKQQALEGGCVEVLARSVMQQRLPELLAHYSS